MALRAAPRLLMFPFVATLVLGCAADEGRRRSRQPDRRAEASATPTDEGRSQTGRSPAMEPWFDEPVGAPARTLLVDRFATITVPDPAPPPEPRPRRRGAVNVDLAGAPFDDVARMLADVGGFGLVVEAPSAGTVRASFRKVDAWDALEAICGAKGLDLRYERGIAIVKAP